MKKTSAFDQLGQRRLANVFLADELDQGTILLLDLCIPGVCCLLIHVIVCGPKGSPDVLLSGAVRIIIVRC